jgi:hypothetical protein
MLAPIRRMLVGLSIGFFVQRLPVGRIIVWPVRPAGATEIVVDYPSSQIPDFCAGK